MHFTHYDMDHSAGGGLHDTNRSNDLLMFCNYITQGDTNSSCIVTSPPDIVVAANIEDSSRSETDLRHKSTERFPFEESQVDVACSCSAADNDTGEEITVTEEEIAQLNHFEADINEPDYHIPSITVDGEEALEGSSDSGGDYLSHDNICKTINDITSNRQIAEVFIPGIGMSQNTLLETALSMSKITPQTVPTGGEEFLSIGLNQPQNSSGYPTSTWPIDSMNDNGISGTNPCEASSTYVSSRHTYTPTNVGHTDLGSYASTNLNNTYAHGVLSSTAYQEQQQYMPQQNRNIIGNQLNQLLQNTSYQSQDFQTHLRPESLPVSRTPELPSISSSYSNKIESFHQNSQFGATTVPISHAQTADMLQTYSTPFSISNKTSSDGLPVSGHIHQIESGEDNIMEDRSGEKKLTTTPIPSDAEKMSSSSSVSSGSREESPSPRDLEADCSMKEAMMGINSSHLHHKNGNISNYRNVDHHASDMQRIRCDPVVQNALSNSTVVLNNDEVSNPVPVAENTVEIDESSMEFNRVEIADSNNGLSKLLPSGSGSTALNTPQLPSEGSTQNKTIPNFAPDDDHIGEGHGNRIKHHRINDQLSSWSVMKEERRKLKLQKKLKKLKHQNEQNQIHSDKREHAGTLNGNLLNIDEKSSYHKHKHRNRSKSHGKGVSTTYAPNDRLPASAAKNSFPSASSGLIPKVTADPTNTSNLSRMNYLPPKNITEKVKSRKDKHSGKNHGALSRSSKQTQNISPHENTQPTAKKSHLDSCKSSPIAPPKLQVGVNQVDAGVHRWQTVTAIQGPKLPPMLSERDRIPKRGRPSKKMTELNLKLKPDPPPAPKEVVDKVALNNEKLTATGSSVVSIYTINDKGFIEQLDAKPKENRRSKEQAEAFRNMLSEISKKSSIQKKTAGAKDVVGAFKAVGVRTRKQASNNTCNDANDKKKKCQGKGNPIGNDNESNKHKEKTVMEDNGMFTFSELAKQFKISNSILYRAMEQSQRSALSRKNTKKIKDNGHQHRNSSHAKPASLSEKANKVVPSGRLDSSAPEKKLTSSLSNNVQGGKNYCKVPAKESSISDVDLPPLKPVSLSSDRSGGPEDEIVKRKKKKKKHKKERGENDKKKKSKVKKKKTKHKEKRVRELSDSVFTTEATVLPTPAKNNGSSSSPVKESKSSPVASPAADAKKLATFTTQSSKLSQKDLARAKNRGVSKHDSNRNTNASTRTMSISSLSGCEEAYDAGDSSSDIEVCIKNAKSAEDKDIPQTSTATDKKSIPSIFGSSVNAVMPTFQGLKEHGGLMQFSERTKSVDETNLLRCKKHKHKKKKFVGKAKSACDPKFLCEMEELVKQLESMKLCTSVQFIANAFMGKISNVFAAGLQPKSGSSLFQSPGDKDSFSYRDPAKNRSKQKKQNVFNVPRSAPDAASSACGTSHEQSSMSMFCRAEFFRKHGYIKPFSGPPVNTFLKTSQVPSSQKNASSNLFADIIKDSSSKPFGFSSVNGSSSFIQASTSKPEEFSKSISASKVDLKSGNLSIPNKKSIKRKPGWPKGRPRGPRAKKPCLDVEEETNDIVQIEDCGEESLRKTSNLVQAPEISTRSTESASQSVFESPEKRSFGGQGTSSQDDDSEKSPPAVSRLNHELLHHIKAAISAKFTSSDMSLDTVEKTLDTAFASYLQRLDTSVNLPFSTPGNLHESVTSSKGNFQDESKQNEGIAFSSNSLKHDLPVKRSRGRPPKYPKLSKPGNAVSCNNEDMNKTSEKHPKKLWASLHKDLASNSPNFLGKPKKRGPGRPRKYSLENLQQNAAPSNSKGQNSISDEAALLVSSCRRASALYTPKARQLNKQNRAASPRRTQKGRGRKAQSNSVLSNTKYSHLSASLSSSLPEDKKGAVRNHKSKAISSGQVSSKDFKQERKAQLEFATSDAGVSTECSENDISNHISEAIDTTMKSVCSGTESNNSAIKQRLSTSSDTSQKGCSKKSLESVVAKLKSKQSAASLDQVILSSDSSSSGLKTQDEMEQAPCATDDDSQGSQNSKSETTFSYTEMVEPASPTTSDIVVNVDLDDNRKQIVSTVDSWKDENNHITSSQAKVKEFQKSGLFSAALKSGSCDDHKNVDDEDGQTLFESLSIAQEYILENQANFQLPYNIWRMFSKKLITTQEDLAQRYTKITKNVYVDTQPITEQETRACVCQTDEASDEKACGKECLNRLMHMECSPDTCPCGQRCRNRDIQNGRWFPHIEPFKTNNRGWGIKATKPVAIGQFILEYVGEVISEREFQRRTKETYGALSDQYCVQLENNKMIDGNRLANIGRFVNHSCEPNCEMQKWISTGEYRVCLFAKRSINVGEELTCDYNFHTFELNRQQVCKCGASGCRGIIGGRSQRVYAEGSLNRMSKVLIGHKKTNDSAKESDGLLHTIICDNSLQQTPIEEKNFIQSHKIFLFRNLTQIKLQHERAKLLGTKPQLDKVFLNGSEVPGSVEIENRNSRLLYEIIKGIFSEVMTCKDDSGVSIAIPFFQLPTKQNNLGHYDHSNDPVDLSYVQDKIGTDQYESLDDFSTDLLHAFRNAEKHHGRKTSLAKDVGKLRRVFTAARNAAAAKLGGLTEKNKELEELQSELEDRRKNGDYIRCICGIYKDEGLMIQCEKCYVWQHCDCMKVSPSDYNEGTSYLCEECDHREVPKEVEVVPQPPSAPPGHTYYLTLLKDSLLVKVGDCARLIHDHCLRQRSSNNPPVRSSYRLQSHSTSDRMDFFRIKKLWTDDNGDKFAYGQHYIRPHDSKHSESRLFFTNELLATSFHEIVPLEAVVSLICVMELATYRRGRPKGFKEADLYICQHRVDLSFRIVNKVIRTSYPICTKPHVFDAFPVRLTTVRDFQVPEQFRKTQSRRTQWFKSIDRNTKSDEEDSSGDETDGGNNVDEIVGFETFSRDPEMQNSPTGSERNVKERRLDGILSKLRNNASTRTTSSAME
ncbi:uncharacterized protein LOC143445104 isoform X1 [Clavelina lepadiformis]|uniref:uncharacterized protein LOC143445104 isoform X1 n=1 Tax=Clavelina lepadiformis TaxID=159417 RepID=UPI0040421D79